MHYKEDDRMLSEVVRAMMSYYGPVAIIQSVIIETDNVIREMSVSGHIKEAKEFSIMLDKMRMALHG